MTITYAHKVSTAGRIGSFFKLLALWRGSIYKLMYTEYLIWITLYMAISCLYRLALNESQRQKFEVAVQICNKYEHLIPMKFILAFYVAKVVSRWWSQFKALPWPDEVAFMMGVFCPGDDKTSRLIRRTVVRYTVLTIIEVLRQISSKVKKRFPTYNHLVEAGVMTNNEMKALERAQTMTDYPVYWVPITWASNLAVQAYENKYIKEVGFFLGLIREMSQIQVKCREVFSYTLTCFPLVYTQIVTLTVYAFFLSSIVGQQFIYPLHEQEDYYFPIYASLQFIFYVGWLKVAETLINPWGEDDDDFDTNYMVDRNIQFAFQLIDQIGRHPPEMEEDMWWNESVPHELPYTIEALPFRRETDMAITEDSGQLRKDDIVPVFLNGHKNLMVPEEANKLMGSSWSIMSGIKEAMSGQKPNDPEVPQFNNNLLHPYKSVSKGVAKSLRTGHVNRAFDNEESQKRRRKTQATLFKSFKDVENENFVRLQHMSMRVNVNPQKKECPSEPRRRKSTSVLDIN